MIQETEENFKIKLLHSQRLQSSGYYEKGAIREPKKKGGHLEIKYIIAKLRIINY